MNMKNKRSDIISVFARVSTTQVLRDMRLYHNFVLFGNIMNVARQYGIESIPVQDGIKFSAPKSRMQMFVEKLHFSQIEYCEIL